MRALRAFTVVVLALGLTAAACGSGGSSESPAQAKAKITAAWTQFFDPAVPLAAKKNIVENYNGLLPILQQQQSNPQAQSIKAAVKDVTLQAKQATVRYDIVNSKDGTPLLPNASGTAIKVGDNWVVSQQTFCQLIKLADQNAKCP
jgi:ABC-type glycerol-3-phosphate transport system substrate-binding protein